MKAYVWLLFILSFSIAKNTQLSGKSQVSNLSKGLAQFKHPDFKSASNAFHRNLEHGEFQSAALRLRLNPWLGYVEFKALSEQIIKYLRASKKKGLSLSKSSVARLIKTNDLQKLAMMNSKKIHGDNFNLDILSMAEKRGFKSSPEVKTLSNMLGLPKKDQNDILHKSHINIPFTTSRTDFHRNFNILNPVMLKAS